MPFPSPLKVQCDGVPHTERAVAHQCSTPSPFNDSLCRKMNIRTSLRRVSVGGGFVSSLILTPNPYIWRSFTSD